MFEKLKNVIMQGAIVFGEISLLGSRWEKTAEKLTQTKLKLKEAEEKIAFLELARKKLTML